MVRRLLLFFFILFQLQHTLFASDENVIIKIDSLLKLSHSYRTNVEIESAIEVAYEALNLSTDINYSKGKLKAFLNLARILFYQGSYKKSLEYLSFAENEKASSESVASLFEISRIRGQIFTYLKLERQSIREFQKCLDIAKQIEPRQRYNALSMSYENLYVVYDMLGQTDSAYYYLKKNRELLESVDEETVYYNKINLYTSIGNWHAKEGELELAHDYFSKALNLSEKHQFPYLSRTYLYIGDMEASRDKPDSALFYYNKALKNLDVTKIKGEYSLVYQSIADLYANFGLTDSANVYLQKQNVIEKELSQAKANSVEKALEVFLNEERKIQEKKQKKSTTIFLISLVSFLVLAIIIGRSARKKFIEKRNRLKDELDESIKEINEKEQEARLLEKKINESFLEVIELAKSSDPSFLKRFKEVYSEETDEILKEHPNLTNSEFILCALMFLNFSTKEIAAYSFVEHRSVQTKKNRLRKKLNLPAGSDIQNYLYTLTNNEN